MKEVDTEILIAKRGEVPETSLYAKIYTKSGRLGTRDVMILIPGGPGNDHSMYNSEPYSITKALLPYVDIILFDPRGCGQSAPSPVNYCTLEHYINDIEAIRQYFNISPNQWVVFGQSYGSLAALGYAIHYAKQLKQLILIGGAVSGEFLVDAKANLERIATPEQLRQAEKIWTGNFTKDENEMSHYYRVMAPLYSSSYQSGDKSTVVDCNIDILNYGWGHFLKQFDFSKSLGEITCPTFIFWGEDDWIFDLKQAELLRQGIPHCELVIYKRCGHLLWIDEWERFVKKMKVLIDVTGN